MADAGELLREAQYTFHNVSHGESPDNRRNTARAKSLAHKIIRKFPTSAEADQARQILDRLDPDSATPSRQREPEHPFDQRDHHDQVDQHHRPIDIDVRDKRRTSTKHDWKKLLLRLSQMHSTIRNLILVGMFMLFILVPFAAFVIVAVVIFLAGPFEKHHPQGTQEALDKLYLELDTWSRKR